MEELTISRPKTRPSGDHDLVSQWLTAFNVALEALDSQALAALFMEDSHWRDLMAFTWTITPHDGRAAIIEGLMQAQPRVGVHSLKIAKGRTPARRVKRIGNEVIEAIVSFETQAGRGHGLLRLPASQPDKAWLLMTSLEELKGFEEPVNERRPSGDDYSRIFGGRNWADVRRDEQAFEGREPAVLVVGAGQAGLSIAARLKRLGVDTLVIDKLERVGDVWRNRYHALALHNGVSLNQMAYMPFPPSWPNYLPKDMLGNWIESYAWAMECNVWTGTTLVEGSYDDEAGQWNARVRSADGIERVLHPRHLVFANGVAGAPLRAKAPGLEDFKGEVIHTHGYKEGSAWKGKNVLVLGAGTSGHDIAQDLHGHGANVKLIQRGSVTVASVKAAGLNHALYYDEGLPTEDCDLIATSPTYPLLIKGYQLTVKRMREMDKDLLAGLEARGFKLDFGDDDTGHQMKFRRRHGGYYLNCGCSELIVSGQVGLLQYEDIDRFVADGLLTKDGRIEMAELVVTAIGYQNQQDVVREILGDAIADKVGQIWGIAPDGELANMFRPTPQKGLWFSGGGLAQARIYSKYIALGIKASEAGLVG
jgi:lactate dehydrogenase-like 2-hydroxyacid dehydrogenase